jgi:phospholipase C
MSIGDSDGRAAGLTRREALRNIGLAGLGVGAAAAGTDALVAAAADAARPKLGTLKDIEHVVILIQENRSFDHYFGTLSGVRGFGDKVGRAAFKQKDGTKTQLPFHLPDDCLPDLTHDWGPQHKSWDHGHMDGFLAAHDFTDPAGVGPETMGYYTRADLPFYYDLADTFTICDGYHCSVLGPTDPNRLMSLSATIDPAGTHGGPVLQTNTSPASRLGKVSWKTMPEQLSAHGVSWKVYTEGGGGFFDNVLYYFSQYAAGTPLAARGIDPVYPDDFMSDLASNKLPQVSWLLTNLTASEHPGFSGAVSGEIAVRQIIEMLVAHPKTWAKTALFITWDENGGFFDHVAPPVPPPGTAGEFVTVKPLPNDPSFHGVSDGFAGPIGLGFRVPMLVVSPYSRGGLVCSDVFDHTSTLRFIETRFGVKVPNLSKWRRKTCGDLTSAFNFAAPPVTKAPKLLNPKMPAECAVTRTPPTPSPQGIPKQEKGTRKHPSGIVKVGH